MGQVDLARLSPPHALTREYETANFQCEEATLARWLKERSLRNESEGASRTYVVAAGREVVGFYCLSAGAVSRAAAPSSIRRNMPEAIPVILLGRLAVHQAWANQGIGSGLLKDAVLRSIAAAETLGVRAMLCHAMSPRAKAFYLKYGFVESPLDSMTVMLNLSRLVGTMSNESGAAAK